MSYILEALKKSQQERQIGHVPDITQMQDVPLSRPTPRWPRWLLAALLLNAVILVVLAWRSWEARMAAIVNEPSLAVAPSVPSPAPTPPVATPAAPMIATAKPEPAPPPVPPVSAIAPAAETEPKPEIAPMPEAETLPPPEAMPPLAEDAPLASQAEAPPRWQDIPLEERTGLPAPRIDVHVFDQDPARRFVLIDLRKYQAGDTLDGGVTIDAIIADGIVLSYDGRKYRVDRP